MKEIIVSTGDVKRNYEVIGPVYIQVSNKGLFGSTLDRLTGKYYNEINKKQAAGDFSPKQADWGFLYGEWSVGQNQFDEAFYVCVRELQEKARKMHGDAIIWLRQDIDLDTNGFTYFYLQMYGTVVKFTGNDIDYSRASYIIDSIYRKMINEINPEEADNIELKRTEMQEQEKKVSEICTKLKSELINIELKNHTVEKQINKLQEDLKTSTSVVEQTKIRKNINILEKQREENEHQMVTGKERLLEAENELSTLKEELLSMEQLLYDKQRKI